jgi:very-short-patch-repair endonuclease
VSAAGIAALAGRQDGVVTRAQLLSLGVSGHAIDRRLRAGELLRVHWGVYAVGHGVLSDRGRIRAALLAVPRAVGSHRTAAWLHKLILTLPAVLELTVNGRGGRSRPGLVIHEATRPVPMQRRQGFPVTEPLRTLQDLQFPERPTREALARRLIRPEDVPGGPAPTRSELERRMLRLIRAAALPEPLVNHAIGPYVIDFAWPEHGVLVETDGWATHGYRAAFERDRARDAHLAAIGYVVLRFTWRQVAEQPIQVAATIAATLSRGSRAPARAPS